MNTAPLDSLPQSIRDLAEVIGVAAALTIVKERGGIRLYVPMSVSDDHWLMCLGERSFKALVSHYAGEDLEIPRCVEALVAARHQLIKADADSGMSISRIARKYHYTERGIRKVLRRMEQEQESNQQQIELDF